MTWITGFLRRRNHCARCGREMLRIDGVRRCLTSCTSQRLSFDRAHEPALTPAVSDPPESPLMKKASWKTTLGGALSAAGAALVGSEDETVRLIGQLLTIIGPIILGLAARDNGVTSEQARAKR
jgi:hypothetical protein